MQWGDLVAELWLYVPLIGFWLVAILMGLLGIVASLKARNRPGGIEYEFSASEPEGIRHEFSSSERDAAHLDRPEHPSRPMRPADETPPMRPPEPLNSGDQH